MKVSKTSGGHRRIRLVDALDSAHSRDIPTFLDPFRPWEANVWLAVAEMEETGSFRRIHNLALAWLQRGEADLLTRLLVEVGKRPGTSFSGFLDEGIRGLMTRVGDEWARGRLAVGEEHMASQVVLEVLLRLRPGWDGPEASSGGAEDETRIAVVGAVEGDQHHLGALGIRVLLEREGWKVYYLGADVPLEEFARIQRAQGADLVCVSFSPNKRLPDLQRAVRVLGKLHRPDFPYSLVLGGGFQGVPEEAVPVGPFQARTVVTSAGDFLRWVRTRSDQPRTIRTRRVA